MDRELAETEPKTLADAVMGPLRDHDTLQACYVADHILTEVTESMTADPEFTLTPVSREDEGLAVLAGAYLGGRRGVMLMQSSGFALCGGTLGSVLIPYQIPMVMLVGLRGDLGEFNIAQVRGGQSVERICGTLGIPYWAPSSLEELNQLLPDAAFTAFSTKLPVCVGIRRSLTT